VGEVSARGIDVTRSDCLHKARKESQVKCKSTTSHFQHQVVCLPSDEGFDAVVRSPAAQQSAPGDASSPIGVAVA
jgi:hypothetical protein